MSILKYQTGRILGFRSRLNGVKPEDLNVYKYSYVNILEEIAALRILMTQLTSGKSAYQIWLDQGNEGTEEDFLRSLGNTVFVGTMPPTGTPISGDMWWNSEQGQLKIYYEDGDSSQWVDAAAGII
jgi:hypothetical protein